jgi:hypothetical protein
MIITFFLPFQEKDNRGFNRVKVPVQSGFFPTNNKPSWFAESCHTVVARILQPVPRRKGEKKRENKRLVRSQNHFTWGHSRKEKRRNKIAAKSFDAYRPGCAGAH